MAHETVNGDPFEVWTVDGRFYTTTYTNATGLPWDDDELELGPFESEAEAIQATAIYPLSFGEIE